MGAWDDHDSDDGNPNDNEYDDIDSWGGETPDFLNLDYARTRSRQTETEIRNEEIHKWLRGQDTGQDT